MSQEYHAPSSSKNQKSVLLPWGGHDFPRTPAALLINGNLIYYNEVNLILAVINHRNSNAAEEAVAARFKLSGGIFNPPLVIGSKEKTAGL